MPDWSPDIRFDKALHAWGTPGFVDVLKMQLEQISADRLPLQQGLSTGNYVADEPFTVVINRVAEAGDVIRATVGIFFKSVIGGCSCNDDPTPASEINEYCEVQLEIDTHSAATAVALVNED